MIRLFISLYLFVIISISAINWCSEYLWRQLDDLPSSQVVLVEKVANIIALTLNENNLLALEQRLGITISPINHSDIAWLDWQEKALHNNRPVLTIDENNCIYAYITRNKQLYRIGPFKEAADKVVLKQFILLISYLCLAALIAAWLLPLWRDLQRLKHASIAFTSGPNPALISVKSSSSIAPVLHTFNAMTEQISRLIDEQKQLTNAVSHEIRTPLSRLKFSFAMLDNSAVSQLASMRQDVDEMESLIDEMLNYGRLESQGDNLNIMEVNIAQLTNNLIDKLARHSSLSIEINMSDNLMWQCDGHLIERALQNYITNAMRYAKNVVNVSIVTINNQLEIHVDDDGQGISPQNREKVFSPFMRLDKSRNKENGGFGLGLAIVKRITQWHQGRCDVCDSKLGGAKFIIILPSISRENVLKH